MSVARGIIRALLVEDNPGDARLIREMLRDAGAGLASVELTWVDRLSAGLEHLSEHTADIVLLDLSLPDSRGLETFAAVHSAAPETPIVVLSGLDDEDLAVTAVHEGAQDYLVKGQVDGGTLLRAMRYAIERQRLEAVRRDLERQRDEFFSSISHDLRTPVAAIKAAIGVILANRPADMPPPLHRLMSNIDQAADELAALINDQADMKVVGNVGTVADVFEAATRLDPDVVLLDFRLPDGAGPDAANAIRGIRPAARMIFLTREDSDAARFAAVQSGASAFLHKSRAAAEVVAAIRDVARGKMLITPRTIATLLAKRRGIDAQLERLTPREREVLRLGISYTTVRTHIRSLGSKLAVHSKLEAIVKARELGLIS